MTMNLNLNLTSNLTSTRISNLNISDIKTKEYLNKDRNNFVGHILYGLVIVEVKRVYTVDRKSGLYSTVKLRSLKSRF